MRRRIILSQLVLAALFAIVAWQYLYSGTSAKPLVITVPEQVGEFDHSHAQFTQVLRGSVNNERLNYAAIERDPGDLRAYLEPVPLSEKLPRVGQSGKMR